MHSMDLQANPGRLFLQAIDMGVTFRYDEEIIL